MKKTIALLLALLLYMGVCVASAEAADSFTSAKAPVSNFSEIAPLKKVLLQRPGNEFLNLTRGSGLASSIFDGYEAYQGDIGGRKNGVLISKDDGEIFNYALGKLDDRGRMFVKAGDAVYEGMIVGVHNRDNDIVVNATRTKQLTNFRASGKDEAIKITPPIELTLEYGVEFIEDDELVEITPKIIRLRKRHLTEHERRRASRDTAS